jgi:hypothetical protein
MPITEDQLMEHLGDLEKSILKGDALQGQNPEGGLATEGTPLSSKAVKKALVLLGIDEAKAELMVKAMDEGEDEEDDDKDGKDDCAKSTAEEAASRLAASVGDAGAALTKGVVDDNADDANTVDVSAFIKGLVDTNAKAVGKMENTINDLNKSIQDTNTRDRAMDTKIAKAFMSIGSAVSALRTEVAALSNAPAARPQPQTTSLAKGMEISEPYMQGGQPDHTGGPQASDLTQVPLLKVQEALVSKAMAGAIDPMLVTKFEAEKNFALLPQHIIKALETELCR